jgi:DNA-binding transcriptional ArsR family regulator
MAAVRGSYLAAIGGLLADRTRAELLSVLLDGRAWTGGELARAVGVAPSTASEHLSKLLDAGLVTVEPQGRHRYFRLAGGDVAELLERLDASAIGPRCAGPVRVPPDLAFARSCYDHLAGALAVTLRDHLLRSGVVEVGDGAPVLTTGGRTVLARLGVDAAAGNGRRPPLRDCLDWSERRHHIGGAVGADLLRAMTARSWLVRTGTPRALRLTTAGRTGLLEVLGLDVDAHVGARRNVDGAASSDDHDALAAS